MKQRVNLKPLEPFLEGGQNDLDAFAPRAINVIGTWRGLSFAVSQDETGYTHLSVSTPSGPATQSQGKALMRMWGVKPVGGRIATGRASHWEVQA